MRLRKTHLVRQLLQLEVEQKDGKKFRLWSELKLKYKKSKLLIRFLMRIQ